MDTIFFCSYAELLNQGFTILVVFLGVVFLFCFALFFSVDYSQSLPFYIKSSPFAIENTVKAIQLYMGSCATAHDLPVRPLREPICLSYPDQPHLEPPFTPSAHLSGTPT